jgi:oligopeptide transport system substrate-binding protein
MVVEGVEMKKTVKFSIALLLSALLINLAGCLPMDQAQIDAQARARYQQLTKPTLAPEKNSGRPRELADEQVLRLSGRYFYYMDPATSSNMEWVMMDQLFVGLTRQDPSSSSSCLQWQKKWKVSKDHLTWTFTLRDDIPWVSYDVDSGQVQEARDEQGNVRYVTAADFKNGIIRVLDPQIYSFEASILQDIQGAQDYLTSAGSAENVGIEAPSDSELVIRLNQPSAALDAISELVIFTASPAWDTDTTNILKYSYGPYVLKEYTAEESISLIRNPFWKAMEGLPESVLEEIGFDLAPEQDILTAYKDGGLDAVELYPDEYLNVSTDADLQDQIKVMNGNCGYYLLFSNIDTARSLLRKAVRQLRRRSTRPGQ